MPIFLERPEHDFIYYRETRIVLRQLEDNPRR